MVKYTINKKPHASRLILLKSVFATLAILFWLLFSLLLHGSWRRSRGRGSLRLARLWQYGSFTAAGNQCTRTTFASRTMLANGLFLNSIFIMSLKYSKRMVLHLSPIKLNTE